MQRGAQPVSRRREHPYAAEALHGSPSEQSDVRVYFVYDAVTARTPHAVRVVKRYGEGNRRLRRCFRCWSD